MATKDLHGKQYQSVLKDWVCDLPLRMQGTLLTGIRGCDLTPKFPLDSTARTFTAFVRCAIMNPFDYREIDSEPGCFMQTELPDNWKPSEFGHLPDHYVMHLIHCLEIIGRESDEAKFAMPALDAYGRFCKALHLNPETSDQMYARLTEDRIANNNIVE